MTLPVVPVEAVAAAGLAVGALIFATTRVAARVIDGGHAHSRARLRGMSEAAAAAVGSPRPQAVVMRSRRGPAIPALRVWIDQAGVMWEPIDVLVMTALAAVAAGAVAFVLTRSFVAAVLGAVLGAAAPWAVLRRKATARSARLDAQVVDMVELLASSLKSGFGVVQSLELAAREQPEPMSTELKRVVREIHLGGDTEESLARFARRAGDSDLTLVMTAVLVQRRVGGDLAEVLVNLAGTIRDRIRIRGEVRSLTAQARMSAWLVGVLPVGLSAVLFVLAPAHISLLYTDPVGRVMAVVAVVLELVGFLMVKRVSQIDY